MIRSSRTGFGSCKELITVFIINFDKYAVFIVLLNKYEAYSIYPYSRMCHI